MSFVRLERGNDWGVDYYALPGQALENGFADQRRGIKFRQGQPINVRWPDGSVTTEHVTLKERNGTVGDMGHTYEVSYDEPGFNVDVRGVSTWVAIDSVDVWAPHLEDPK